MNKPTTAQITLVESTRMRLGFDPVEAVKEAVGQGLVSAPPQARLPDKYLVKVVKKSGPMTEPEAVEAGRNQVSEARLRLARECLIAAAQDEPKLLVNHDFKTALRNVRKLLKDL